MGHTVLETVQVTVEHNIGAVPELRNGKLVGIFSERDLMKRGVAEGRAPRSTCMAEVMTDDPLTISMNKDLENCITLMRRHSFRHLPVCPEGHLVGMVSLRDILLHDLNEKDDEVRMMRAYVHSMPDDNCFARPGDLVPAILVPGVSSLRPQALSSPLSVAKTDFFHWHEGNLAPGVSSTVTLLAITSVH